MRRAARYHRHRRALDGGVQLPHQRGAEGAWSGAATNPACASRAEQEMKPEAALLPSVVLQKFYSGGFRIYL
ncbi:MAG: hypothetical protein IPK65_11900 [Gammaproteobacteria bacterium]|nr:hypothetical protein [Gammaproteobacteria bacterium]